MAVKESNITCLNCGRQTEKTGEGKYRCAYCGHSFEEDNVQDQAEQMRAELGAGVSIALEQARERDIANARYNLYEAAHEKYTDDEKVLQCARELKKYLPKDVQANFYETAIKRNAEKLNKYINGIDTDKYGYLSDDITEFMLKSMEKRNVLSVKAYIERAYGKDKDKRLEYITKAEDEAEKIDDGIYTAEVPRDVFVAYSSKDRARVNETVEYLESNKISCFVAERNLRHGKGAVARYEELLKTAMDNCKCVVYMSSENSRDLDCDALRVELPYIKSKRKSMGRIEYILDEYGDSTKAGAKKLLKEFFDGLEYCRDTDDLIARIVPYKTKRAEAKDAKYCADCGTENPSAAKLCMECGCRKFFDTQDEYSLFKEQEREKQEEIERIKEETERAKREELERAQRESEQRLAEIERQKQAEIERLKAENERLRSARAGENKAAVNADRKGRADAQKKCAACGGLNDGDAKFCMFCGGNKFVAVSSPSQKSGGGGILAKQFKQVKEQVATAVTDAANKAGAAITGAAKRLGDILEVGGAAHESAATKTSDLNDYDRSAFEMYGTTLKKYKGKGGDVAIPQGVTSIGHSAFSGCSTLNNVWLPNSVTKIERNAFGGCRALTYIDMPKTLKSIDSFAFHDCVCLTKVDIPDGIKKIEDHVFNGCRSLKNVILGNGVTSIGDWAFEGCSGLTSITIPDSVTSIGNRAFDYCSSLTSITIPDSVTSIGNRAFDYCSSLTSITIPDSVTSIGEYAFCGCSNLTIYCEAASKPNGWNSDWNHFKYPVVWDCKNNDRDSNGYAYAVIDGVRYSFKDGRAAVVGRRLSNIIGSIDIPSSVTYNGRSYSVTSIGDDAFSYCSGLTSVTIPNSVTSIGNCAFDGCRSLTSITIPDSVTSIGDAAFRDCKSLTSITIPNSVTSIGDDAFYGCSSLTSITIPDSVTSIGDDAFRNCSSLTSVTVPVGVIIIGNRVFSYCSSLTSITILNSVTSIGYWAFLDCGKLTSITYGGTKKQWKAIKKHRGWKKGTGKFTVICTDGNTK